MQPRARILVVDDDLPILNLMSNVLRQLGFEPLTASAGEEAIAMAKSQRPDLILLDMNMPGMGGGEVCEMLRVEPDLSAVPVVFLSGEPVMPDEIERFGAVAAIQKPFDLTMLIATIREQLVLPEVTE